MRCVVTAGPTYEELDEVRRMTNFSSGTLGTELANFLVKQGHEVELLRGHYSACRIDPATPHLQIFTTTADLAARLERLSSDTVNAVFHTAAVSDFAFGKIWRRDDNGQLSEIKSRKIPTREGALLAELTPTPKLISRLRDWFPKARLTGWKYEVEGGRADVISLAHQQIRDNRTDACVLNGPAYGARFGLMQRDGTLSELADKAALFSALYATIQTS